MVHGDNEGLKLPPYIAPTQIMIVPIRVKDENNVKKAQEIKELLVKNDIRVDIDLTDKSPGFKFADCEMRGIPLRIEIGPKDIENNQVVFVRRDTHEKIQINIDDIVNETKNMLDEIQKNMYDTAKKHLDSHIYEANTKEELIKTLDEKTGFVRVMHCGDEKCEEALKDETGITSRCIPFDKKLSGNKCAICGKEAKYEVIFGRAY